jgi:CPA2 family monovalent cation:H+ antiporter-2
LLVAATVAIILIGKPLAALAIALAMQYPLHVALSVAVALAQIGEFSFILATLGRQIGILPEEATNVLVASALVSISVNPLLYRTIDSIQLRLKRVPQLDAWLNRPQMVSAGDKTEDRPQRHAVVVGYGPVGRTLVRMLQDNDIEPTVVELNLDTVHRLRQEGIRAVYGDSTHRETLDAAGIKTAITLFLTSAGMRGSDEAFRIAREINPGLHVLVRAGYLREIPALRRAETDVVFSSEGEVALTMTEFL